MQAICRSHLLATRPRPITWTCVQRCRGHRHRPNRRNPAQPSAGRDIPQGPRRRCGDAAGVVLRRPDGARRRRARQGRARHRLHLLLVEEPSDRRGLPGPDAPGALLHRRQRQHGDARGEGAARDDADDRRRARGGGRLHNGAAQQQRPGGAHRPRPHRRRDPPPHPFGDGPRRRPPHGVRARDDLLRRAGPRRQRLCQLPRDRRSTHAMSSASSSRGHRPQGDRQFRPAT